VLDVLGSVIPDKFAAVGSGAEIAVGVLEQEYKEELSTAEAKDLAIRAVKSAISRDVMSGDGVDIMILTKEGMREESMKF
jgi:proteasome beta subunit